MTVEKRKASFRIIRAAFVAAAMTLLAAVSPGAHADPEPPTAGMPPPPVTFGLFDGPIPQLKRLKTTWTRVDVRWSDVEATKGTFDWTATDAKVLPRTRAGLRVIIMVHSDTTWGSVCGTPGIFSAPKTAEAAAFQRFARRLVERYDGDGVDDAARLLTPVQDWQVENQWVTAVFYRGSDNCGAAGFGDDSLVQLGVGDAEAVPEDSGSPAVAASEYRREYRSFYQAAKAADRDARVGPGNIPTQTVDASLFCQGKLGRIFVQNEVGSDGSITATREFRRADVCLLAGENTDNIKTWRKYWNPVLNRVMRNLRGRVDFVDLAQYGRYEYVPMRNQWAEESFQAWGYSTIPTLMNWETGGPDRRVTVPDARAQRQVAMEVPKRLSLALSSGADSVVWFHNWQNPNAAPGVRFTSLRGVGGRAFPAAFTYRQLVSQVAGAEDATLERIGADDEGYVVRFKFASGREVAVAWSEVGLDAEIAVNRDSVTVIMASGRRTAPSDTRAAPGNLLSIRLTSTPVYIIQ